MSRTSFENKECATLYITITLCIQKGDNCSFTFITFSIVELIKSGWQTTSVGKIPTYDGDCVLLTVVTV